MHHRDFRFSSQKLKESLKPKNTFIVFIARVHWYNKNSIRRQERQRTKKTRESTFERLR